MALKSIFIPFFEEKASETAFRAAMMLAKDDKAHISAAHMRARPAPPANVYFPLGGVSTEFTENFQKAEDQLADSLKALFAKLCEETGAGAVKMEERTKDHGVTASWTEMEGDPLSDYARRATAFDLSVLAAAGDDSTPMEESIAESLLFQSGRPVLLCPAAGIAAAPEKIVIAWNGSEEAARAVGASLELLKEAKEVMVISVRKSGAPFINTDEITAYLRLHGVNAARTKIEVTGDESVNARLDAEIREEKPDLLVMGAYSHSRWRQAVLGGFTRHMIHEAKLPVLMMH
ncbi:universal stress protein [Hyphococcus sp.]|uniref:universal stress protein n=1 Tax=Hyphococcus sp. TaxID=2038636 RepID=UPI003D0B6DCE